MAKSDDKDVLQRYDGRGVILKVRQSLEIDKMQLSFVSYGQDNKMTSYVNCFIDAADFGLLMERIRDKSLQKQIYAEKQRCQAAGEKYPHFIYDSPFGGGTMKNGTAVSRHFTISPAASDKFDVTFTGYAYPASRSRTGAFIPVKGAQAVARINVSTTYHGLALLAYKWQWLEKDYMERKYNMASMKSDYQYGNHGEPEGTVPPQQDDTVQPADVPQPQQIEQTVPAPESSAIEMSIAESEDDLPF